MGQWWSGLSDTQKQLFILCGFLGVFVVGMAVGIFGVCNVATWEVMAHLGFGSALTSLVATLYYFMAEIV